MTLQRLSKQDKVLWVTAQTETPADPARDCQEQQEPCAETAWSHAGLLASLQSLPRQAPGQLPSSVPRPRNPQHLPPPLQIPAPPASLSTTSRLPVLPVLILTALGERPPGPALGPLGRHDLPQSRSTSRCQSAPGTPLGGAQPPSGRRLQEASMRVIANSPA